MSGLISAYAKGPVLTAPGPSGRQMWRSIPSIRQAPMEFLARAAAEHGDIVQFPIPVPASYFINHPDHVRHVLVNNARHTDKRTMQYQGLSVLTGDGLLTCDPPAWRERRQVVQPAFHHEAVARMCRDIEAATDDMLARWRNHPKVDIESEMMFLALDIVGRTLFGADMSEGAKELSHTTVRALDAVVRRARQPLRLPLAVPTMGNVRLRTAIRALDDAVVQLIRSRAAGAHGDPTMLDLIIDAYGGTVGEGLPRAVRDEIVTFIVAGHETVASGLTWALNSLMRDGEAWRLLAHASGDAASALARSAFEESLRLFPPAWLITRRLRAADSFGDVTFPSGSLIIMSPWAVHRDSRWWERPEQFDVTRFLDPAKVPRGVYFPFGAGARMCIGRDMALLEGAIALARITSACRLTPVSLESVPVNASVTLRPAEPLVARVDWTGP